MNYAFVAVIAASTLSISSAQTGKPIFEVASIRRNLSGGEPSAVYFREGRFVVENASIKMIIAYAYDVKDFQISGGPSWLDTEKFNITAKEEESDTQSRQRFPWKQYREQLGLMVQSLLADRFKLRVSHRPRELPMLALVIAKGGLKINRSTTPNIHSSEIRGRRGQLIAKGLSLAQLADFLSWMPELGVRKVEDETRIDGAFDLSLRWAFDRTPSAESASIPNASGPPGSAAPPDASSPSIFDALQEQLGLKLEARKGPVDFLTIDYIEKPSEN